MAQRDDFELQQVELHKDVDPSGEKGGSLARWILLLLLAAIVGGAAYYYFQRTAPVEAPAEVATSPEAPRDIPIATAPPEGRTDLPALDASDELVRGLVQGLSSHPEVARWLLTRGLVRNYVGVVDSVARGQTPRRLLRPLAPAEGFSARETEGRIVVDPQSYRRYDALVQAFGSLDAEGFAKIHRDLAPLTQNAYRELGHPDADFDAAFEAAVIELLETPVLEGELALRPHGVGYELEDERLAGLSPVQRQLLRTGPENVRIVQAKLREIARAVGIPEQRLPGP